MTGPPSLVIAGGGIGGLTAALAYASHGIPSHVLERGPGLEQSGAGIQISPNAGRILDALGLADAIAEFASEPIALQIRNRHGAMLASMPLGGPFRQRHGVPYRTIHRADLLQVLSNAAAKSPLIDIAADSFVQSFAAIGGDVSVSIRHDGTDEALSADGLVGR